MFKSLKSRKQKKQGGENRFSCGRMFELCVGACRVPSVRLAASPRCYMMITSRQLQSPLLAHVTSS